MIPVCGGGCRRASVRDRITARRCHAAGLLLVLAALAGCAAPQAVPLPPTSPRMTDDRITVGDGAVLPLRRWMPEGRPRAVIVALHGFNDYSKAFEGPASYWASRGVATYAYDQRGFGRGPQRGLWAGHDVLASDVAAAVSLVRGRHPGIPVHVLGESMGGAVAMIAAAAGLLEADGLILVAPAIGGPRYLGPVLRGLLWFASRTVPWFPVTGEGLSIRASDNSGMLRRLGQDPLVIKQTRIATVEGLVVAMDAAQAAAERLRIPALLLYGSRDELVLSRPFRDAVAALPPEVGHRTAIYRSGWHMLLRDLEAKTVHDDIAAWIADRRAPLPSDPERVRQGE